MGSSAINRIIATAFEARRGLCCGAAVIGFGVLSACTPMPSETGDVAVVLEFTDGRVETRPLAARSVRLEGCRDVQRLRLYGEPGAGERLWSEILIDDEGQAVPVRLAYAGALSDGAYASWDGASDLSQRYRDPYLSSDVVARPALQPVDATVSVDAPWAAAPDVARVAIEIDGAFRAEWWLSEFRYATVYCDQVVGETP